MENFPDYTPKQTDWHRLAHVTTERKGFNPKTIFSKLYWHSNFVKFHNKLMAYFIQQGMGYIDDKQFQEAYRTGEGTMQETAYHQDLNPYRETVQ